MAKYAYDHFYRYDDFVIERETQTLFIKHPMSALLLHRQLSDLFDDIEFITDDVITLRITDDLIKVSPKWKVVNIDMCGGQLVQRDG